MAAVEFAKVEGLGNDFILIDHRTLGDEALRAAIAWTSAHAEALCDRRRGIGADGILLVGPGRAGARGSMIVINFDGSRPEMCGNGLRCVAAYLAERERTSSLVVETDAGPRTCEVERVGAGAEVRIDMGEATLLGVQTPAAGGERSFMGVSMGNPHAVSFVAADEQPEALARRLGPAIELDPVYAPSKTNVEFARVQGAGPQPVIELSVWERGVGITQACGTGACATAVAAAHAGLVPFDAAIEVRLPGGRLLITAPREPGHGVIMVGPCRQAFSGRLLESAYD